MNEEPGTMVAEDELDALSTSKFYSTRDLEPSLQFEAWRHFYRDIFDLSLVDSGSPPFPADHRSLALGAGLELTRASMPDTFRRQWRHFSKARRDDWLLVIVPNKAERPLQFRSLTRPYEAVGGDGEVITLHISRDAFSAESRELDSLPETIERTTRSALFTDYLLILDQSLPALPRRSLPMIEYTTKHLFLALIAPNHERRERAAAPLDSLLMKRAQAAIINNISDASFGPNQLGYSLGMSRSKLYRLFEPFGGVASFILDRRLAEARRRLMSKGSDETIVQLAFDVGFTDHSTFSRAFKRKYGLTPREARELGSRPINLI